MMVRLALMLIAVLAGTPAVAQSDDAGWPNRPIRFIVPFPAGSATDTLARLIGQKLSDRLRQNLVIENRVGASGNLGSDAIARAAPDGYTIGFATTSTHAVAVSLSPNLPYDPLRDFAPVAMIATAPYVLGIYPGLPAKNVAELVALAKARPRALNYSSAGPASLAHLAGVLFSHLTATELTHVPYRSSAQAMLDLVEGRIEIQFGTLAPTIPHIREGRMRALAVTSAKRVTALPDVPTLVEAGIPGYEASLWVAVVAPAAVPPAIVARLNRELNAVLNMPDTRDALLAQGMEAEQGAAEHVRARIRADIEKWREVISKAGIRAE
jgi:tripartite-type tricarboxylate transporter receptor subunit TctC